MGAWKKLKQSGKTGNREGMPHLICKYSSSRENNTEADIHAIRPTSVS